MGNNFTAEEKGDECFNISAQKIQELQEKIRNVDDTMCGFVQTLDCMISACELLFRQCDKRHELKESEGGYLKDIIADEKLALDLLKTIEESVSNHRRTALHSLGRLLNYLIDAGKDMVTETKGDDAELFLVKYLSKQEQNENVNDNKNFADWMIESLQKEVKLARELIERNIEDISHLENRNKLNRENLDIVRERNSKNKERLASLQKKYEQLETENKMLQEKLQSDEKWKHEKEASTTQIEAKVSTQSSKTIVETNNESNVEDLKVHRYNLDDVIAEKEMLEKKLNMLHRKQYLYVQLMLSKEVGSTNPIEDVVANIKKKLESSTTLIQVIKEYSYRDFRDLNQDVPMLFFCKKFEFQTYSATFNLRKANGFNQKEQIAWVALHETLESDNENDCVQRSGEFKDFAGVFNIFSNYKGKLHVSSSINETNIQDLAAFVNSKGLRRSVLEVHGLLDD